MSTLNGRMELCWRRLDKYVLVSVGCVIFVHLVRCGGDEDGLSPRLVSEHACGLKSFLVSRAALLSGSHEHICFSHHNVSYCCNCLVLLCWAQDQGRG